MGFQYGCLGFFLKRGNVLLYKNRNFAKTGRTPTMISKCGFRPMLGALSSAKSVNSKMFDNVSLKSS